MVILEFGILVFGHLGSLEFCLAVAKLVLQLQYYFCNCNTSVAVKILVLLGYPNKTKSGNYIGSCSSNCSTSGLKPELSSVERWLV